MTRLHFGQLGRTVIQLRPAQVAHRARLRGQRAVLDRLPQARDWLMSGPGPDRAHGWPAGHLPLDGRVDASWPALTDLQARQIRLLGVARDLGEPYDWRQASEPQLWRFHLHYWDWAWGLAADPDRIAAQKLFAELWQSWRAAASVGGDAWHPYPASLRAWSWCGLHREMVAGSDIDGCFIADLGKHAGFLRWHLERDVGGNHLVKNLKALAGLAIFFDDERLLRRALRRLTGQLAIQVLGDGGHYERAPAYHCQVLADLIDIADLLRSAGRTRPPELDLTIGRMRTWLGIVVSPDGELPLLNDGYPVARGLLSLLRPASSPADRLLALLDTGLVRASAGGWRLLADVGLPCPAELPADAHADSLTCIVHVDGMPLLVDAGTSGYAPGPARRYERSTAAHNTVEVDGANSTEVWGAFRAGRRARVHGLEARATASAVQVSASHDGFRALPGGPCHHRHWELAEAGLQVRDEITGSGSHSVVVRWHLAPGSHAVLTDAGADGRYARRPF